MELVLLEEKQRRFFDDNLPREAQATHRRIL